MQILSMKMTLLTTAGLSWYLLIFSWLLSGGSKKPLRGSRMLQILGADVVA